MIWAFGTCSDFYSCYVNSRMSVSIHIDIVDGLTRSLKSLKFGHKISKVEEWKHHLNRKRCIKVRFSLVPELIIESFESKYVLCVLCSKPLLIRLILCGHLWNELQLQILTFFSNFRRNGFTNEYVGYPCSNWGSKPVGQTRGRTFSRSGCCCSPAKKHESATTI